MPLLRWRSESFRQADRCPPRFWWLSILCSILPDADVLSFVFGIDYGSLLGTED
jgi:hypothetical protein